MSQLTITYILMQSAMFLIAIGGYFQVSKFLRHNSSIADGSNFDAFKNLVRVNMYVAILSILVAIPTVLLSIYISWTEGFFGIGLVLGTSIPQILFSKKLKMFEQRSKQLHCSDQFADEYRLVADAWTKKLLPNF